MSTIAQQIAKLQQERRELEKRAYILSALIGDKLTSEEAKGRYEAELREIEQQLTSKSAEVVRLQQQPKQLSLL